MQSVQTCFTFFTYFSSLLFVSFRTLQQLNACTWNTWIWFISLHIGRAKLHFMCTRNSLFPRFLTHLWPQDEILSTFLANSKPRDTVQCHVLIHLCPQEFVLTTWVLASVSRIKWPSSKSGNELYLTCTHGILRAWWSNMWPPWPLQSSVSLHTCILSTYQNSSPQLHPACYVSHGRKN